MRNADFTDKELNRIEKILFTHSGNVLNSGKYTLELRRLKKRVLETTADSFSTYLDSVDEDKSGELEFFINALTRNGSYFFRCFNHFEFIKSVVIPNLVLNKSRKCVRIWSAACSTGEEPYSIAMVCKEMLESASDWKPVIFASDINSNALEVAKKGSYWKYSVHAVPKKFNRFFNTSNDGKSVVLPEIKQMVSFAKHNLLDKFSQSKLDIVFLRNVLVYFDSVIKEKVIQNVYDVMNTNGYLFTHVLDTLCDIKTKFMLVAPGIYTRVV